MKKIMLLATFVFTFFFLGIMNVKADSVNYVTFSLGGISFMRGEPLVTPPSLISNAVRNFNFEGGIYHDTNVESGSNTNALYFKVAICTTQPFWLSNGTNGYDAYVNNTSYSCNIDVLGKVGHVSFIYFRTEFNSSKLIFSGNILINTPAPFNAQYMYFQSSYVAFQYDESDSVDILAEILEAQKNQSTEIKDAIDQNTEAVKDQTDYIKDDNVSDASDSANSFFGDFEGDDYGLSDIIKMPLTFINGLANNQCNSLVVPLPFVNKNVVLPCMTTIYQQYFGSFLTIYQTITTGFIAYWVCINIFRMVQGFKNPETDQIEVMDL